MDEILTLSHTIALLAYRDDTIARALSGLPGNEASEAIRDERQLAEAWKRWDDLDEAHLSTAKDKLWLAVQSGRIPVFDTSGEVEPTFWLTHDLDSPGAQFLRFGRSDLGPLLHEGGGGPLKAWIRADLLFQLLEELGIADPIARVMPTLRSGQLTGWLGDDENAVTARTRIETRWLVLGMVLHRSGRLTKCRVPVAQHAALRQVPAGSVWFVPEELRRLGVVPPPGGSCRAALLTRLNEWKRHERRWFQGADLADHFAHQRGAITTLEREALFDEACQQIFRSLLHGTFTDEHQLPHVRPHQLNDAGSQRMTPEQADHFRRTHWDGRRDRDGEPVLSDRLLRKLMLDVWLPARCVIVWCQERNFRLPHGHAAPATSLATAVTDINDRSQMGPPRQDASAPRVTEPVHEGHNQWAREDFTRPSTRVENLVGWARRKYTLPTNRDDQTIPGRNELLHDHKAEFGVIMGINEKTMRQVRTAMTTEKQRRGGAPAHREYK